MESSLNDWLNKIKGEEDFFQKARLIREMIREKQISIKDLSRFLSLKPAYICHILRLNRIPEIIVDGYYSKLVTLSHLFTLSRIKNQAKMIEIYEKVLAENLNVLDTGYLVREALYGIKTEGERLSGDEWEELRRFFSCDKPEARVKLVQSRVKSKITLEIPGSLKKTTGFLRQLSDLVKIKKR